MSAHLHASVVPGCYRCELGQDEAEAARWEARTEAAGLRDMAEDFRSIDMPHAADLCDEKADALEAEARA